MKNNPEQSVGVGLLVVRDQREILLSQRKTGHGIGEWAGPGGKRIDGETYYETAVRELEEEVGSELIVGRNLLQLCQKEFQDNDYRSILTIGVVASYLCGEALNTEHEKHGEWGWYTLDELPQPIFPPTALFIEEYRRYPDDQMSAWLNHKSQ